jgi:hypothetical protein
MKHSTLVITATVLASLASGGGQALGTPGPAPTRQLPAGTCAMSADAVEAWTARGAVLPSCVRDRLAAEGRDACVMSADAVEAWTARGARLPACVVEAAPSR